MAIILQMRMLLKALLPGLWLNFQVFFQCLDDSLSLPAMGAAKWTNAPASSAACSDPSFSVMVSLVFCVLTSCFHRLQCSAVFLVCAGSSFVVSSLVLEYSCASF